MVESAVDPIDRLTGLVRDALHHLYDVAYLQTHPLARALGARSEGGPSHRGRVLCRALLEAIESLQPVAGVPMESRTWRSYRLLELRYIEGLPHDEVLAQLAISKSQYQRDQALAIEAVASYLQDRWHLGQDDTQPSGEVERRKSLALAEARELTGQMSAEEIDLGQILGDLLALIYPAAQENRLALSLRSDPDLPRVRADRVALRHAFLELINRSLEHRALSIEITVRATPEAVDVNVVTTPAWQGHDGLPPDSFDPEVDLARRLIESTGGTLSVRLLDSTGRLEMRVSVPLGRRPVVLVVDNHPDFIGLVARYLAEQSWRVVGAEDVPQALRLALDLAPQVILLDVMLPGQDGWDLLLSLKSRPETKEIPVIVCSVLYEPQVARALGAASYLAKPVTQAKLLEAIAPWSAKPQWEDCRDAEVTRATEGTGARRRPGATA